MIKAIAIDDEPLALNVIQAFCSKVSYIDLQETFTNLSAAKKYLEEHDVDLLFLDIHMPSMTGINFYKSLADKLMVIFTTAYAEYAVDGFDLSAVDYLLKPIEYERFEKAVIKAREYHDFKKSGDKQFIFVKADYTVYKIDTADIIFIESLDNYVKVHLKDDRDILTRVSMKAILDDLPSGGFIRVHRSYAVSYQMVTALRNKVLYLNDKEIPIGTNYVDDIVKLFNK